MMSKLTKPNTSAKRFTYEEVEYFLVQCSAPDIERQANFIFVIVDISGSMNRKGRIQAFREAMKKVIKNSSDDTVMCILTFEIKVRFLFGDNEQKFILLNEEGKRSAIQ